MHQIVPHQRITSRLPVISSPWFLLSLAPTPSALAILIDGVAPIAKIVGVELNRTIGDDVNVA